jgi:hypothetical protein
VNAAQDAKAMLVSLAFRGILDSKTDFLNTVWSGWWRRNVTSMAFNRYSFVRSQLLQIK